MAPQVLDIGTICPKCDFEFVVTYVSHEAEAAEAGRDAQFETNVRLLQENIELRARAAQLEAERDEARMELQRIRTMLDEGETDDSITAIEMVKRMHAQCYELAHQIAAAVAEEREACAKVAEQRHIIYGIQAAAEIRARK